MHLEIRFQRQHDPSVPLLSYEETGVGLGRSLRNLETNRGVEFPGSVGGAQISDLRGPVNGPPDPTAK